MYYIKERDIITWKNHFEIKFLNCACKFTQMSSHNESTSKRLEMKKLIEEFRKINPYIESNIFKSAYNVNLRTVIGYHKDDEIYTFLDDYDKKN